MLKESTKLSLHDTIIGALPPRPWFRTSLLAHTWIVDKRKPGERSDPVKLEFDVPVEAWPSCSSLTDEKHEKDLITSKLLIYFALEPEEGWIQTNSTLPNFHRRNINFVRFRIDRGIKSNSDLRAVHHRDFEESYWQNGSDGILNAERRVESLLKGVELGQVNLPTETGYLHSVPMMRLLGLQQNQLGRNGKAVLIRYGISKGIPFSPTGKDMILRRVKPRMNTAVQDHIIWHHLVVLRDQLGHDPIGYVAYPDVSDLNRAMYRYRKASRGRRTPDAPPYQTSWLINAALNLILNGVADTIVSFAETAPLSWNPEFLPPPLLEEINSKLRHLGFGEVSSYYRSSTSIVGASFRTVLFKLLPAACLIAIAAFSARRISELMAMRPGCLTEDRYDQLWLETWISKNIRQTTRVPANATMAAAIKLLTRIRKIADRYKPSEWLLDYADGNGNVDFVPNESLKLFSRWCSVPPLADGTYWPFAAHQFRKFFAVTHQWRFFFPNLLVLNRQLRQTDLNTTAAYTKMEAGKVLRLHDERESKRKRGAAAVIKDRAATLKEEEQRFVRHICEEAINGTLNLGSPGGRALTKDLKAAFSEQMEVLSSGDVEAAFNKKLTAFIRGKSVKTHPEGHSLCGCGATAKDKCSAVCLLLKSQLEGSSPENEPGADYAYSDDESCGRCIQNIRIPQLLPYWDRALAQAVVASKSDNPAVREHATRRMQFVENVIFECSR